MSIAELAAARSAMSCLKPNTCGGPAAILAKPVARDIGVTSTCWLGLGASCTAVEEGRDSAIFASLRQASQDALTTPLAAAQVTRPHDLGNTVQLVGDLLPLGHGELDSRIILHRQVPTVQGVHVASRHRAVPEQRDTLEAEVLEPSIRSLAVGQLVELSDRRRVGLEHIARREE